MKLALNHFFSGLVLERSEGSVRTPLVSIRISDQPRWLCLPLGKEWFHPSRIQAYPEAQFELLLRVGETSQESWKTRKTGSGDSGDNSIFFEPIDIGFNSYGYNEFGESDGVIES